MWKGWKSSATSSGNPTPRSRTAIHTSASAPYSFDEKCPLHRKIPCHRITRVHDEVKKDLLELDAFDQDARKRFGQPGCQRHTATNKVAVSQLQDLAHVFIHVERPRRGLASAQERAEAFDDLTCTAVFVDNIADNGFQFFQIGRLRIEEKLGGLRVAENDSERLVEFVGECSESTPSEETRER